MPYTPHHDHRRTDRRHTAPRRRDAYARDDRRDRDRSPPPASTGWRGVYRRLAVPAPDDGPEADHDRDDTDRELGDGRRDARARTDGGRPDGTAPRGADHGRPPFAVPPVGTTVVDLEAPDTDDGTATVVDRFPDTRAADHYVPALDETVDAANPGYRADAPVVAVAFDADLDAADVDVAAALRRGGADGLRAAVDEGWVRTYDYPVDRVRPTAPPPDVDGLDDVLRERFPHVADDAEHARYDGAPAETLARALERAADRLRARGYEQMVDAAREDPRDARWGDRAGGGADDGTAGGDRR